MNSCPASSSRDHQISIRQPETGNQSKLGVKKQLELRSLINGVPLRERKAITTLVNMINNQAGSFKLLQNDQY